MSAPALCRSAARLALLTVGLLGAPTAAQPADDRTSPADALVALTDTSQAASRATLQIEHARLDLARGEVRAETGWRRWRPDLGLYVSLATRGLAFPSVSSQGYDPVYAAIARWPGDSWGLTLSWNVDQVLDRRPADRARAAVTVAEGRIALHHARQDQRRADARSRALAQARRDADRQRRVGALSAQLQVEAGFLARRLDAQRELLRLAEMTYRQGESDYAALARQRLAVLAAEHAQATNAARLDALTAAGDPALASRADAP